MTSPQHIPRTMDPFERKLQKLERRLQRLKQAEIAIILLLCFGLGYSISGLIHGQ